MRQAEKELANMKQAEKENNLMDYLIEKAKLLDTENPPKQKNATLAFHTHPKRNKIPPNYRI